MENQNELLKRSGELWEEEILPVLTEYIAIPNKSSDFDPEWKKNGHMDKVVNLFKTYAESQIEHVPGMTVNVHEIEGKSPVIFIDIPGTIDGNLFMYGHLDKQPEMEGWDEGKGPWTPVREGSRLYGRGGADDGYAMFAAIASARMLTERNIPHSRIAILIEANEESGSQDLPPHLEVLSEQIGTPDGIICLDSGAGDYERLWETSTLRGIIMGTLRVAVLSKGEHSGSISGMAPDSYRIANAQIRKIENPETGEVLLDALKTEIPGEVVAQAEALAVLFKDKFIEEMPFLDGVKPMSLDIAQLILNKTWRPALTVTGDNLPAIENAGNVVRPFTELRLSMRIPPGVDPVPASEAMKEALEKDPLYGAKVEFTVNHAASGWRAPDKAPWLEEAIKEASQEHFGNEAMAWGEGGAIPFMKMLGDTYPKAQFLVTGILGPDSSAHGPNEFLEIETVKKLTASISTIVAKHGEFMTAQQVGPRPYQS